VAEGGVKVLLSYHPVWLQLGLEAVTGLSMGCTPGECVRQYACTRMTCRDIFRTPNFPLLMHTGTASKDAFRVFLRTSFLDDEGLRSHAGASSMQRASNPNLLVRQQACSHVNHSSMCSPASGMACCDASHHQALLDTNDRVVHYTQADLNKLVMKRFLLLVLLLDKAAQLPTLPASAPLLFQTTSKIKTSSQVRPNCSSHAPEYSTPQPAVR
jgi:hypothetical protein